MSDQLHVLFIEDSEDDTLLVIRELRHNGFTPCWERVETAKDLETMLSTRPWDVIISDYTLPQFSAPAALTIVKQLEMDIPFIVVAGSIGEQLAVEMMKAGAHDYVMKDCLTRLPEAVRRELRDAKNRAERQQAQTAINRQLAAIETAIDGIGIVQDDKYIYINQSYLTLFGYDSADELIGKNWKTLYAPDQIQHLEQEILPKLELDRAWQGEAIATRRDNTSFIQGMSLSLTEDNLLISVCRDISDLKKAQELLIHNTLHDPLTHLPNRELLTERINLAINRAKRHPDYHYAVLFLDLDRFKVINDSLGHIFGDQLLVAIAQKLNQHMRNIDLVARLGGDEFVILLEEVQNTQSVLHAVERILEDFRSPLQIHNHELFTSVSIGIVLGNQNYHHASELIRDADTAMYRAKAKNRGSYKFFDADMYTQAMNRLTLETDLHKALEHNEFVVYYQPIINLTNSKLSGFEALTRWQHPIHGLIAPINFIPVAEETGFIPAIDRAVFYHACQQIASWQTQSLNNEAFKININVSAQSLRRSTFLQDIDEILQNTEINGSSITIELTESMLIEDVEQTIDLLIQIASRQIQISIDDFGTGYSSLNYLHRLPVHTIKIDKSFVRNIQTNNSNYQVVQTIITLSRQLGLTTVAEGIETVEQLNYLKALGCEYGQGYLFSSPLPASAIEAQL